MGEKTVDARTGYSYSTASAWDLVPITPGPGTLAKSARAILCETAGRLNLTCLGTPGSAATVRQNVPMQAGWNPVHATVIDAPSSGTAATGVFAAI